MVPKARSDRSGRAFGWDLRAPDQRAGRAIVGRRRGAVVQAAGEPTERLSAADGVRSYKRLALVEQAFRCLKGIDLLVRPIHHRTADRVRAPILLCLLAYDVEWHLRQVWESLLFEDEELARDRHRRDPVAPARASESARLKKKTHATPGGLPVQSVRTLLAHLATRCRNTCVVAGDPSRTTFSQVTEADALQAEALRLIEMEPGTGTGSHRKSFATRDIPILPSWNFGLINLPQGSAPAARVSWA